MGFQCDALRCTAPPIRKPYRACYARLQASIHPMRHASLADGILPRDVAGIAFANRLHNHADSIRFDTGIR